MAGGVSTEGEAGALGDGAEGAKAAAGLCGIFMAGEGAVGDEVTGGASGDWGCCGPGRDTGGGPIGGTPVGGPGCANCGMCGMGPGMK